MTPEDFDAQVERVAALGEPVRRSLYRFVVAQPDPVSREQAAAGVGVAHHVAKFGRRVAAVRARADPRSCTGGRRATWR